MAEIGLAIMIVNVTCQIILAVGITIIAWRMKP